MEGQYILNGRSGEEHKLLRMFISKPIYKVESEYPIQITGPADTIVAIDFAGGPTLAVGDVFDDRVIDSIARVDRILYILFK